MITPVQQTPLPLDPIRQQITPTTPVAPPPPPGPSDTPIQAADSSQDKFDPKNKEQQKNQQDQSLTDQQHEAAVSKLRQAYLQLNELQRETSFAIASGDISQAKDLAAAAAEVAQTIPTSVGILQLSTQEGAQQPPSTFQTSDNGQSSTLDIARASLSTAKDVVEAVASIPHHPIADRIAINGMRYRILNAMADVEDIASNAASTQSTVVTVERARTIDLSA